MPGLRRRRSGGRALSEGNPAAGSLSPLQGRQTNEHTHELENDMNDAANQQDQDNGVVELSDSELDRISGGTLRAKEAEESVEIRANKASPMLMLSCATGQHI